MPDKRIVIFGWSNSVHIKRWVDGLSARGYIIKVISLDGEELPGVETVVLSRRNRLSYFTQATRAAREAVKFKPHLVHVHYASGFGVWGLKTHFAPLVVSVWGSDLFKFPSNFLNKTIIRKVLNRATHITATSEMLRKLTISLAPLTKDRVSLIPWGVEVPSEVTPPPPVTKLKICYIKSHKPVYGPDVLLKALVEVKKVFPHVVLSMAGDGPMTSQLKNMIDDLHLSENVKMVGFIEYDRIRSFIAEHHMMVMPSRMESFGVAALDASAAGRAVIASDVGGISEVVRDGKTGYLVNPDDPKALADKIIHLAQNHGLMIEMGKAGHEFVKNNFTWEKSLDLMSELYERLIDEHKNK